MGFDFVFALELVLVALLILGAIAGAFYIASSNRRGGEPGDGTEGRSGSAEQRAQADPHEFYKRTSLENDEDMKMHLYSVNEYEMEFGSDLHSRGGSRFVAALKSYRPVGDEVRLASGEGGPRPRSLTRRLRGRQPARSAPAPQASARPPYRGAGPTLRPESLLPAAYKRLRQ